MKNTINPIPDKIFNMHFIFSNISLKYKIIDTILFEYINEKLFNYRIFRNDIVHISNVSLDLIQMLNKK